MDFREFGRLLLLLASWNIDYIKTAEESLEVNSDVESLYTRIGGEVSLEFTIKFSVKINVEFEIQREKSIKRIKIAIVTFDDSRNYNFSTVQSSDNVYNESRVSFSYQQPKATLKIKDIIKDDINASVQCKAMIPGDEFSDKFVKIKIIKADPPVFADMQIFQEKDYYIKKGTEDVLICRGSGIPEPEIYWKVKGELQDKGEMLKIENASVENTTGIYECIAKNAGGEVSINLTVFVMYIQLNESSIYKPNQKQSLKDGEISMECPIDALPNDKLDEGKQCNIEKNCVSYEWLKDGTVVGNNKKYDKKSLDEKDVGNYSCTGKNRAGSYTIHMLELTSEQGGANILPTVGNLTKSKGWSVLSSILLISLNVIMVRVLQ